MFQKLLKVRKLARPSPRPEPPKPAYTPDEEPSSSALKIVHAGGSIECYFMPIPVARIIDRYPSFYVTRPEVFRRPWESVVGPDETLALGEKYYLVPRHTVKKLRRRTRRPSRDDRSVADLSASRSFHGRAVAIRRKDGDWSGSFVKLDDVSGESDASADYFKVSKRKSSTDKKHVRFLEIDEKPRKGPSTTAAAERKRQGKVAVENARKGPKKKSQAGGEKGKVKVTPNWQPALASISEIYGSDE